MDTMMLMNNDIHVKLIESTKKHTQATLIDYCCNKNSGVVIRWYNMRNCPPFAYASLTPIIVLSSCLLLPFLIYFSGASFDKTWKFVPSSGYIALCLEGSLLLSKRDLANLYSDWFQTFNVIIYKAIYTKENFYEWQISHSYNS